MSGPIPNPSPTFQPAMRIISAITNEASASVTTTFDHDYLTGTIVRLNVPSADGMYQVDKMTGTITVTGATTFTIDIDTIAFDVFAIPGGVSRHVNTIATVIPIGEVNETLAAATQKCIALLIFNKEPKWQILH